MAPRRETGSEAEAFRARLSRADRQRLISEHRAYLGGDRQVDAEFGEEPREDSGSSAKRRRVYPPQDHSTVNGEERRTIATVTQRMVDRRAAKAAEKKKDGPPAKRKRSVTKRKYPRVSKAALAWEEKQVKESRVVARAESAAARRSITKANERERAALEERRGSETRNRALADLKRKRGAETTTVTKPTTATGDKTTRNSTTTSHTAESTRDSPAQDAAGLP
ncbi:hypothetical protein PI124_g191 [Phytophthora idaei]|nr:hypothetical protein PI124_g191 [Phytophthora idaei]